MRTTITIDEDVASQLKKLMTRGRLTLKDAVNQTLRRGLSGQSVAARPGRRYRVKSFNSGFRPGIDPLKLNQLVDDLEVRRDSAR